MPYTLDEISKADALRCIQIIQELSEESPMDRSNTALMLVAIGACNHLEATQARMSAAIEVAISYGQIDGDHHKAWVIDQMVRALSEGEADYARIVREAKAGQDGPHTYSWSDGIPPLNTQRERENAAVCDSASRCPGPTDSRSRPKTGVTPRRDGDSFRCVRGITCDCRAGFCAEDNRAMWKRILAGRT